MSTMRVRLNELRSIILEALRNAYQVLGLSPNASEDEIKKAWRNLAIQNHPDRGGSHGAMVDINNAKDRLLDKTALFRYGPNIKGYEDAHAPPAASASPPPRPGAPAPGNSGSAGEQPDMYTCVICGRRVRGKEVPGDPSRRRLVAHYTVAGGATPCPGTGLKVAVRGPGSSANPPPRPNPPPPPPGAPTAWFSGVWRRFVNTTAGHSKFWEVMFDEEARSLTTRWGRIGATGQTKTKTFRMSHMAKNAGLDLIYDKKSKGYVEVPATARGRAAPPPPPPPPPPPRPAAGNAAPGTGGAAGIGRQKDVYKVYPYRGGKRVVRVGGKLYGTRDGGRLPDGGNTRFQGGDRASVTKDGSKMKVGKTDGSNHTQTWDPIDEVRSVVDELVIEMLERIGNS